MIELLEHISLILREVFIVDGSPANFILVEDAVRFAAQAIYLIEQV